MKEEREWLLARLLFSWDRRQRSSDNSSWQYHPGAPPRPNMLGKVLTRQKKKEKFLSEAVTVVA